MEDGREIEGGKVFLSPEVREIIKQIPEERRDVALGLILGNVNPLREARRILKHVQAALDDRVGHPVDSYGTVATRVPVDTGERVKLTQADIDRQMHLIEISNRQAPFAVEFNLNANSARKVDKSLPEEYITGADVQAEPATYSFEYLSEFPEVTIAAITNGLSLWTRIKLAFKMVFRR